MNVYPIRLRVRAVLTSYMYIHSFECTPAASTRAHPPAYHTGMYGIIHTYVTAVYRSSVLCMYVPAILKTHQTNAFNLMYIPTLSNDMSLTVTPPISAKMSPGRAPPIRSAWPMLPSGNLLKPDTQHPTARPSACHTGSAP